MSNIALDRGHHFVDVSGKDHLSKGQREAHGLGAISV